MVKLKYSFPHSSSASKDRKIRRLKCDHGVAGYAVYFCILEILCQKSGYKCKEKDLKDLAEELEIKKETVFSVANNYKLFESDGVYLWSNKQRKLLRYKEGQELTKLRMSKKEPKIWKNLSRIVLERDSFTCLYCGQVGGKLEIDHMQPFSRGGSDELSNLTTSCQTCNRRKHDKTVEEFKSWLRERGEIV